MREQDTIVLKMHDLLKHLVPILNRLPRDQKYVLGDRLQRQLMDVQELLLEAYYEREQRAQRLRKANIALEKARFTLRLMHELHYVDAKRFAHLSGLVNELGRMVGGWLRSLGQPPKNFEGPPGPSPT